MRLKQEEIGHGGYHQDNGPTIVNKSFVSAPAAYIIAKNTGASTSAEPRSFCATTSPHWHPYYQGRHDETAKMGEIILLGKVRGKSDNHPDLDIFRRLYCKCAYPDPTHGSFRRGSKTKTLASMTRLIT